MVTLTDKYLIPSLLFSQKLPLSSQLVKKKKKKKCALLLSVTVDFLVGIL